jgi:lipoprotein signal peptidase
MADHRTFRWLFIAIAAAGLTVDQASKYGIFRWLYNNPSPRGRDTVPNSFSREILDDGFQLIAQFDPDAPLCNCGFDKLQTWSAPVMPRVNHGALFGMGGSKKGTANGFFAAVSAVAAAAILVWGLRRSTARDMWLMAALGLILAGTVGNLYDRLVFNGVRDFLHFYYIEWPVFNFADCCLVVGATLLLLQALFGPHPADEKPASPEERAIADAPGS